MSLIGRALGRVFGGGKPPAGPAAPRASYDSAKATDENRRHWAHVTDTHPNDAAGHEERRTLRARARYECKNNCYLAGLVKTLAHDTVGTGPRLQLHAGGDAADRGREVERAWAAWSRAADLTDTLRLLHECRVRDGESFGVLSSNPLCPHPVKLWLRPVEADRVCSPHAAYDPLVVDGIRFDAHGNPASYAVQRDRPNGVWAGRYEYDTLPAAAVVHWFRPDRPGQARGVSELAAALVLAPQMRRYTLATVTAAEVAAMLAGVMKTDQPAEYANPEGTGAAPSFDRVEMERGALLSLPPGWSAEQFKPEQPTTTYADFKAELLGEMGRALCVPYNVIAGSSKGYNYSSGRLDHQIYHRSVWIERERLRSRVLDRLFAAWLEEATLVGLVPDGLPPVAAWEWDWHWDGFASIDPGKDARAAERKLAVNLTTLAAECAADGLDWKDVLAQRAAENAEMKRLGLEPPRPPAAINPNPPADPVGENTHGPTHTEVRHAA